MELFPACSGASRTSYLEQSHREILLFLPSLESCAPYIELLEKKSQAGLTIKILTRRNAEKSELSQRIRAAKIEMRSLVHSRLSRKPYTSKSEVWILDEKIALVNQPVLSELASLKIEGDDVHAIADYFLHHWNSLRFFGRAVSYLIRHKKFSLNTGRGCLQELLQSASRAEAEIFLSIPWPSKRIIQALLNARKRGVQVTLATSRPQRGRLASLRWFIRAKVLREAGVVVFVSPLPSMDFLALIDEKVAFFGNSRLDFLGRHKFEASFGLQEPLICRQFIDILKESSLTSSLSSAKQ